MSKFILVNESMIEDTVIGTMYSKYTGIPITTEVRDCEELYVFDVDNSLHTESTKIVKMSTTEPFFKPGWNIMRPVLENFYNVNEFVSKHELAVIYNYHQAALKYMNGDNEAWVLRNGMYYPSVESDIMKDYDVFLSSLKRLISEKVDIRNVYIGNVTLGIQREKFNHVKASIINHDIRMSQWLIRYLAFSSDLTVAYEDRKGIRQTVWYAKSERGDLAYHRMTGEPEHVTN